LKRKIKQTRKRGGVMSETTIITPCPHCDKPVSSWVYTDYINSLEQENANLKAEVERLKEAKHCLEFERDFLIADQKALIQKYRIEYVDLIVARREYKQAEQKVKEVV